MKKYLPFIFAGLLTAFALDPLGAYASDPTDEVTDYEVTAEVNEDATVDLTYHIEWKVLDSDSLGPVSWLTIGVPNSHCTDIEAISSNIREIAYTGDSGDYLRVDFDKKYYEGETISFDFSFTQDYLYEMNNLTEGETVYYFAPGWFDDVTIDRLEIRWKAENATSWSSGALNKDGYLTWENTTLSAGETFEVDVTYPNEAYSFDTSKSLEEGDYFSDEDFYDYYGEDDDDGTVIFVVVFFAVIGSIIVKGVKGIINTISDYVGGSGFGSETVKTKKITRTLIKYYPTCPGCGAPRDKEQEVCEYCGRSFIESEEVVEEKEVKEPEKYSSEGTYSYGDSPNTYMRVHVAYIPTPRPPHSSCAHSSCAHSSCACAHSCACACACACAGGGRAGCSTKDFYNTGLKLEQFKLKNKNKDNGGK